ncbi:CRISPR-associated endonuclease Cas1 [Methanolacinia paynteri]|uniref:CRISPR-associated endonuclease Cas1 n=1 Tax=Methanolacinia paynteri TaxID=230356 RepID=UPI00064EDC21|nr:CRISPR-associated endonuclease Cas1 [Methanolacinia paynteri]
METVLVTGRGVKIGRHNKMLYFSERDKKERSISPIDLDLIILSGEFSISSGAIRLLSSHDAGIVVLDNYGRPIGHFLPARKSKVIENYEMQRSLPSKKSLGIAKEICRTSGRNKIALLRSVGRNKGIDCKDIMSSIQCKIELIDEITSKNVLLGIEGITGRLYYEGLKLLLPEDAGFSHRNRHPPCDPVNALLSYGYGILYSHIRRAVVTAGLSPYYGILHSSYKKQEALVYDLIEEFRQPVVDRVVLTLFNKNQVGMNDFSIESGKCTINSQAKRIFSSEIMSRLNSGYLYKSVHLKFNDIIREQAVLMQKAIAGECDYFAFRYR